MLATVVQGALELIFPDNCLLCRQFLDSRHTRQLCPSCLNALHFNPKLFSHPPHEAPLAFDQAWAVCVYNDTASKLLHAFKYNNKTALRKTFLPLMIDFIDRHHLPVSLFDTITPIPLHPARRRERGYNQSALLSLGLSQHYKVAHSEDALTRQRPTSTQTALSQKQRWTNMRGAFRMKNLADVKNKSILLIDDLYTTGATVHNAAETLKNAGALRVVVLTFGLTV